VTQRYLPPPLQSIYYCNGPYNILKILKITILKNLLLFNDLKFYIPSVVIITLLLILNTHEFLRYMFPPLQNIIIQEDLGV